MYNHLYKILIIGNSNVGKSSIIEQFTKNKFNKSLGTTVGIDFDMGNILIEEEIVRLQIWDTAGQERFRNITSSYYRGCDGVFIVYDVTNRETFNNIQYWYNELKKYADNEYVLYLICNKIDLGERCVSYDEGENMAKKIDAKYMEISATSNLLTKMSFNQIAQDIYEKKNKKYSTNLKNSHSIDLTQIDTNKKSCCY